MKGRTELWSCAIVLYLRSCPCDPARQGEEDSLPATSQSRRLCPFPASPLFDDGCESVRRFSESPSAIQLHAVLMSTLTPPGSGDSVPKPLKVAAHSSVNGKNYPSG